MAKNILSNYIQFENLNEMNKAVSAHLEHNYLNTNTAKVLEYLARISSHYLGATRVLQATIADKLSISLSTVKRAVRALEQASIISIYGQRKRSLFGGSCSSIYVINPADYREDELPDELQHELPPTPVRQGAEHTETTDFKQSEPVSTYKYTYNLVNKNILTDQQISSIYKEFKLNKTTFNKALEEFYQKTSNKHVHSPIAYFRGILNNITAHIERRTKQPTDGYISTLKEGNPLTLFSRVFA